MTNHQQAIDKFFDISSFPWKDIFVSVNYPWEVLPEIETYIENIFKSGMIKGNYHGRSDVYIGEGTTVQPGVEIVGPAIIGKNCFLGHASLFRNGCIIGDNVTIGHAVEVKHSLFLNGSAAAHLNYVGDSIIGTNANISGGAMLANFRLDKKSVSVKIGTSHIDTGLTKFGAIVGDGSTIGVNAVLNPGTILGKNCIVYPLTSVKGVYEESSTII